MYLAKNLKYLRLRNGFSQDYVAEKLGYKSYTTIQKWEMGASELKKESEIMEDNTILEVREMQELLDHRTMVENKAIKLMEECKFEEAIELLATI